MDNAKLFRDLEDIGKACKVSCNGAQESARMISRIRQIMQSPEGNLDSDKILLEERDLVVDYIAQRIVKSLPSKKTEEEKLCHILLVVAKYLDFLRSLEE